MKIWLIRIGLALLVASLVLIATNFQFFVIQFKYYTTQSFEKLNSGRAQISENTNELKANSLQVPSLGIETPLVYAEKVSEIHFQEKLADGVVHYPGTAEIGQLGNSYFFGHSSDLPWSKGNYKTVFALLPKIKKDDLIKITDKQGEEFTYKVIATKVVQPTDLSVLDQQGNTKKLLTLQTSYPVGTALRRFVAIAELIE